MARVPGAPLARSAASLVADAEASIRTIPVQDARALLDDAGYRFVDIRDPREVARTGTIRGAVKAPRGMLEFWVDPESPYYRESLDDGRTLVLFCQSGWRSALTAKTLQDMGFETVAHLGGGFSAWQAAGEPVEPVQTG